MGFPTRVLSMCRYKKYVFLDPLAGAVTKTHNTLETEKEEKPFDAPLSITKREQLERQVGFRHEGDVVFQQVCHQGMFSQCLRGVMWVLLFSPLV